MKLNDAIRELVKLGPKATMTRPGGPVVRLAVGQEGALGRYVVDAPEGPAAFDAGKDDLNASGWWASPPAPPKKEMKVVEDPPPPPADDPPPTKGPKPR